jgi:iron complex transport system substrate-binding protein
MTRRTLLLLAIALGLTRCGQPQPAAVRDDLGRSVRVPAHVRRVVTLAPNLTEMVFALGSGDLVAGTDDFSDEPVRAKTLPHVGGMQPNVELIAKLNPDLVLATTNGNHASVEPALQSAHIPLFVVATDRLEQIPAAMETIGRLLGSPRSKEAVSALRAGIAAQKRSRARHPSVLFAVWTDPLYVAGANTYINDLFELTGAVNAVPANVTGWPQYSLEALAQDPPDVMLHPEHSVSAAQLTVLLSRLPEWSRTHRPVGVDDNRFTRPGPRVVSAAADLNRILDEWERTR